VNDLMFLSELEAVIAQRINANPDQSYTARLAAGGLLSVAQKLGEEGVETALAAVAETPQRVVAEASDLVYHLLVLLKLSDLSLADVVAELEHRHQA
jgi:phosphoribosyl-ATP pyrophosphohydrolase/phosphoribosyl-AMP cyclohydrolase